jgi:chromosome segregation ATPase
MSWIVDGVTYESIQARDEAIRRRNERQAQATTGQARRQVDELRSRIQQRERELESARGDLQRQIQINEEIRADVSQLRRTNERLEQAQRAMEQQMEAEFREVYADIEATQADVAELERAHQDHVKQVQRTFTEVRQEMKHGLDEAEKRRRETEERLQAEVEQVNRKVENDRRERLERIHSEMSRAEEAVHTVETALREVEGELVTLGLEEQGQAIREQLAQARSSLQRQDSAAALATANGAFGQVRSLQFSVQRRQAALDTYRSSVMVKVDQLEQRLAGPQIVNWFPAEVEVAHNLLGQLKESAGASYQRYSRMEIQADRDERILDRLEQQVDLMVATAPNIAELAEERKQQAMLIIEKLRRVYGPLSSFDQRWARDNDPKSSLVLNCKFGGARVDVHIGLDGGFTLDGYGHESNATCSAKAESLVAEIGREQRVRRQQVSMENRNAPALAQERRLPTWSNLSSSLEEIRREL